MPKPRRPERPDIEIASGAKAEWLRFEEVPEVDIEAWAEPGGETGSGSDRTRLPDRVRPRVDYTGIEVDQRVAARADRRPESGPGERSGSRTPSHAESARPGDRSRESGDGSTDTSRDGAGRPAGGQPRSRG